MKAHSTCYMCSSPTTSKEHAPPLCFFPEEKEIGRDLRRNLVRVPSCDVHNSEKSKDDEFFRAAILMSAARSSDAAKHQFMQKLLRAAARTPHAYRSFFTNKGEVSEEAAHALQLDRPRFDSCVDHLTRALFFKEYSSKWTQSIFVISPNIFSGVESGRVVPHKPTINAAEVSRQYLGEEPIRGENPEVFRYRLRYDEEEETFAFVAQFYECFEVFTYSSQELGHAAV